MLSSYTIDNVVSIYLVQSDFPLNNSFERILHHHKYVADYRETFFHSKNILYDKYLQENKKLDKLINKKKSSAIEILDENPTI